MISESANEKGWLRVLLAGSRSWVLRFDVAELPHVALFVRDATGVEALDGSTVDPPRLQGTVPDRSALIPEDERSEVASAWGTWWTKIVVGEIDFGSEISVALDSCPTLQRAAIALHREGSDWASEHRSPWLPPRRNGRRDWAIAKNAAEAAAAERGVPLGDVWADTQLLLVDGDWWQRPAPGVLLYSPSVLADEAMLARLLRDTFASSA